MLRIEDTDQERFVEGALEIIYHTLEETGPVSYTHLDVYKRQQYVYDLGNEKQKVFSNAWFGISGELDCFFCHRCV